MERYVIEIGRRDEFGDDWYVWKDEFTSREEAERVMVKDRDEMKVKPLMRVRAY